MKKIRVDNLSHYRITKEGKLYSNWLGDWREVKPIQKNTGYWSNNLIMDDGKRKNFYRHRLVALTFIPNPHNKPQVCHRDNNPSNNDVSNLYWGTAEDNMRQCIHDGRFFFIGYKKKKYINIRRLKRMLSIGYTKSYIARRLKISRVLIYRIMKAYEKEFKER